jgi:2'-5' RNA ligase
VTAPRARRRLFVALEVTGAVAGEIDGLRRAIGSSSLGRIAPHLTLVPPVNVVEHELAQALVILRSVAHEDPVEVVLGPAGTFLPRTPVLYLAVHEPGGRLARLHRQLEVAPLAPPSKRPPRPFTGHVTLSSRMERSAIAAAVPLFADFRVETVLSRLTLYEQQHEEQRHPWVPLADVVLGAGIPASGGRRVGFVVSHVPGPDVAPRHRDGELGGVAVAVIGRDGSDIVAEAYGSVVGAQLAIEWWCVAGQRRSEGIGRALIAACERAAVTLGGQRLAVASRSEGERAFLTHLGYAPSGIAAGESTSWYVLRRLSGE